MEIGTTYLKTLKYHLFSDKVIFPKYITKQKNMSYHLKDLNGQIEIRPRCLLPKTLKQHPLSV